MRRRCSVASGVPASRADERKSEAATAIAEIDTAARAREDEAATGEDVRNEPLTTPGLRYHPSFRERGSRGVSPRASRRGRNRRQHRSRQINSTVTATARRLRAMGPLSGTKVIEIAGIGPGPFCAMMLSDMGAEVVRIDRRSSSGEGSKFDVLNRGRRSLALDLKKQAAVTAILRMVRHADALIEGFRPGVMERLGLGPELCLERNPRLVYGRMTGWGQEGPLAQAAGHDINYIALTGALHAIGPSGGAPVPPLNLIGDFGGGGMLLAFGVVCAMLEAARSGKGQVVDAAMTDGSAALMAAVSGIRARGGWSNERGTNLLDGGAPFYGTYQCKDGKWVSIGSLEPQFYELLREKAGLEKPSVNDRWAKETWANNRVDLGKIFKAKTQA